MSLLSNYRFGRPPQIYHNFPIILSLYFKKKLINEDCNYKDYSIQIQALLMKRQISKSEIIPKIKLIQNIIDNFSKNKKEKTFLSLDENIMKLIYEKGIITKNYWLNILVNKIDYDFYNIVKEKIPLKGQVPSLSDLNQTKEIILKLKYWLNVYDYGFPLSLYEKFLISRYIEEKFNLSRKKEENLFKERDLINYEEFQEYDKTLIIKLFGKGNEQLFNTNNILSKYDQYENIDIRSPYRFNIHEYFDNIEKFQTLSSFSKLKNYIPNSRKSFAIIIEQKAQKMSLMILAQLFTFLNSDFFNKEFSLGNDFYLHHSIFSVYLWIICNRLSNFPLSKFADDIIRNLIEITKETFSNNFELVDALRKISKRISIEESYESQKNSLHWHFNIFLQTRKNPFYKIDALVWTLIFREKIPRFDDRVYKFSYLIVNEFMRFKSLSFDDFINLNLKFEIGLYSIPFNYKDVIFFHNIHLKDQILNYSSERFNDYKIKEFSYQFRLKEDKDKEIIKKSLLIRNEEENYLMKLKSEKSYRKEDDNFDFIIESKNIMEKYLRTGKEVDEFKFILKNDFGSEIWINQFLKKHYKNILEEEELRSNENNTTVITKKMTKKPSKKEILKIKKGGSYLNKNSLLLSDKLEKNEKELLDVYLINLINEKDGFDNNYIIKESKKFNPEANIVIKKKKTLVEKIFRL